jgi:hypothetical protein
MLCRHCGAENPTAFGYCSGCQKPLSVVEGAVAPPPPVQPKTMSLWSGLGILAVLALTILAAMVRPVDPSSQSFQDGERIGGLLASVLFPGLIAYVIAGRKKARKPNLFALIFCLICVLFLATSFVGAMTPESGEQRIGRLMREAAGLQPVRQSLLPRSRRWDDGVREIFRDLLRQNKTYADAFSKIDQSQIGKINTPQSFADPSMAAAALQQLHASYDLDSENEVRVKEALEKLRVAMESGVPSFEREDVEKGFQQGLAAQMPKRRRLVEAEKQWIDAIDSEYAYAHQHEHDLQLVQNHLVISNPAVREEFNMLVREQEARRKELLESKKEFDQFQSRNLQKFGMTAKDVGAQ